MNELTTSKSTSLIAAIKLDRLKEKNYVSPKTKWYQNYVLPEGKYVNSSLPAGHKETREISALEAVSKGIFEGDIRPKLFDKSSQTWTLLDSGSVVSCIPKKDSDVMDSNVRLRSVNGSPIATYGTEEIVIKLNRKPYKMRVIKADIPQKILGWDFFKKHRLHMEWGEFDDLYLVDKKSNIKSVLKCFEEPQSVRINAVDTYEEPEFEVNQKALQFQMQCMRDLDTRVVETRAERTSDNRVEAMTIHPDQVSPMVDDIPLDSEVDECLQKNLKALARIQNEYSELIKKYPRILEANFKKTPTSDISHRIEITGDPFKSKVRPLLATSEKSQMGKKVWEEMEKMGVIERVKPNTLLQYTSPVHLVKKPSGNGYRVCADFRLLNARTKSDNYPLPLLRSFQNNIKGSKIFSKLDLKSAFHHLPIHSADQEKTCVLSPWGGAFVYKRLAFGLTNGPATWQKYIDHVLSGIDGLFCYLDDILICSENVERHMSTLEKLFARLKEHGLTLALDKCVFGQSTVEYLGYQVSATGICPLPRKVEAIQKIATPTTQKLLLHFLGALNYFRSSLSGLTRNGKYHNAANLLQPLYSAATVPIPPKKFEEVWQNSPVLKQAFIDAKQLLVQAAELAHPDPGLPLALMTDASQHSIGAVLMQRNHSGKWSPLGYMSRHLPIDKVAWSTCRKELLAAQSGLRYFIAEIYGRHCTIFSDHAPLVLAFKNPQGFQLHDPVAQRALMEIGQFTKDVRHIAGLKNAGSDFLSRIAPEVKGSAYQEDIVKSADIAALEGFKFQAMSPAVIEEAQSQCNEVIQTRNGQHASSVKFQEIEFGEHKILCETSMSLPRPLLPKALRSFAIQQLHGLSHDGIKESVRRISMYYYWHTMRAEITRYCQTCHGCQSTTPSKITPPHLGKFEVPDKRFTHCHVDIVGPLPESEGYKYLLTIIDRTTRLLFALPVSEPSAKVCSQQFLLHYVSLFGVPSACTSDQGKNFVSNLFQEMQRNLGIDIKHTPIYWPQGNGLLERNHQSLKNSIKAQLIEMGEIHKQNWYHYLPWALLGRRTAFNKDLGTSSSELALGTHVQVPGAVLQQVNGSAEPNINDILQNLQLKENRVAVPTSTNPQVESAAPSEQVTHVYTKQHNVKGLQPKWTGPFRVINRPTRSTLVIKVGVNKDLSDRIELRAWADVKPAYLKNDTVDATRPKLGRPPKPGADDVNSSRVASEESLPPDNTPNLEQNKNKNSNVGGNSSRPPRSTRNPAPNYVASVNFSKPPPKFPMMSWSASSLELEEINRSISGLNP